MLRKCGSIGWNESKGMHPLYLSHPLYPLYPLSPIYPLYPLSPLTAAL
jgi:hypothetical protein